VSSLEKQAETAEHEVARAPFRARIAWAACAIVLAGLLLVVARETDLRRLVVAVVLTLCFAVVAGIIRGVASDGAAACTGLASPGLPQEP